MCQIRITSDEVHATAQEIIDIANESQHLNNRLNAAICKLTSTWNSETLMRMIDAITQLNEDQNKRITILNELAAFIIKASERYYESEEAVSSQVKELLK